MPIACSLDERIAPDGRCRPLPADRLMPGPGGGAAWLSLTGHDQVTRLLTARLQERGG